MTIILQRQAASNSVVNRISPSIRALAAQIGARRAMIFALLFAFLAQAQLAATHFHIGVDAKEQALFGLTDTKSGTAKNKAPRGDQDCPISQLVAATHNYVAGSPVALAPPALVADTALVAPDEPLPVALIALNWQSRAPPCDVATA